MSMRVTHVTPSNGPVALGMAEGWFGPEAGEPAMRLYRKVWGDADMVAIATNYTGYYTATLPDANAPDGAGEAFGSGYLALTVDKKGGVKTAGKLADGTAVSMSSTVLVDESNRVFSVVYTAPTSYRGGSLFGLAEFVKEGGLATRAILRPLDDEPFVWESRKPTATGEYGAGFRRELWLIGGWYDKLGNLSAYYTNLDLSVDVGDGLLPPEITVGTGRYDAVAWDPSGLPLQGNHDALSGAPGGRC
jgi:hypothetical protein